jgi:FAD dependent monooxygenase
MFAEYSCMFGISKDVSQLEVGIAHLCYGPGRSFLLSAGKESTTYWFMFEKMKERYDMSNIPRFTENDVQEAGEKYANVVIAENVKFKEIWDKKASAAKVAMEEGVVKKWHYGRCIALGDAVHKVNIMKSFSREGYISY